MFAMYLWSLWRSRTDQFGKIRHKVAVIIHRGSSLQAEWWTARQNVTQTTAE